MADDTIQYGVSFSEVAPPAVQHMMLLGYIERIEIERVEFTSKRSELVDLTKILVYGNFYRQFDEEVSDAILHSSLVKTWNRNNPSNIIDEKTVVNESYIENLLQSGDVKKQILKEIASSIALNIKRDDKLLNEEKRIKLFLIERFVDGIRPVCWFVLHRFRNENSYDDVIKDISAILELYLDRSTIGEYLSMVIMELLTSGENSNLKAYVNDVYKGQISQQKLMFDPETRKQLFSEMERKKLFLSLGWAIGNPNSTSIGTSNRLKILIYSKGQVFDNMKDMIDESNTQQKGKNISDFYDQVGGMTTELGLNYINYLDDACKKVGIRFKPLVYQIRNNSNSVICLDFHF
ncbi:MAG: hypothetical protein JXR86_06185 [Spirochaetales bacterium]|nr:hypothetical protein [Spirochaetales bacterium]